ncbi:hypothetical protein OG459_22425 [Streptomyces canus]
MCGWRGSSGGVLALTTAAGLPERLQSDKRPGFPTVARALYRNMPSLIAARARYPEVKAPVHLVYGENDWSRPSDRKADKQLLPVAESARPQRS